MTVKVTTKYEMGHSCDEEWDKTDLYCPACGKKEVWAQQGAGDYYCGESYLCMSCRGWFHLPDGVSRVVPEDYVRMQTVVAIEGAA